MMSQYRQKLQVSIGFVSNRLWAQVYITAFDIGFNIFSETWLLVFPANKVFGFINTDMFCQKVVVMSIDELCLNDFRNKQ